MLFGVLPDHWQRAIYNPSPSLAAELQHGPSLGQHQQQAAANGTRPTAAAINNTATIVAAANATSKRLKPDQSQGAGLILDLLYIVLLFLLSILLALAFTLAQYLRRRELEEADEADHELVPADCYHHELGGRTLSAQRESVEWNSTSLMLARRRLLSAMQTNELATDWGCTCGGGGGGLSAGPDGQRPMLSIMAVVSQQQQAANNEFASGGMQTRPDEDKKSQAMRRMIPNAADGPREQHQVGVHGDQADALRRPSSQSATLDHWATDRRQIAASSRRASRAPPSRAEWDTGRLLSDARHVSSKSLADLAIDDAENNNDGDDQDYGETEEERGQLHAANGRAATNSLKRAQSVTPAPLVQKGIYYASGCEPNYANCTRGDQTAKAPGAGPGPFANHTQRGRRKRWSNDEHNHYNHIRYHGHCHYNDQHQSRHRMRVDSAASQCCCSDLAPASCNKAAAALATKLNPSPAINYDQMLLNNHLQQSRRSDSAVSIRSIYNPSTMPPKSWIH